MLDDRKAVILYALVQEYIHTAQPVGSSRLSGSPGVEVSSATVRSELASLEDQEYLVQPHTSAGRIPTVKAYRFFVDQVQDRTPMLEESHSQQVRDFFFDEHDGLSSLLSHTARLLSELTDWAGVVVGPSSAQVVVRLAQLIKVSTQKVLVLAVMSNGSVEKRVLDLPQGATADVVADASQRLAEKVISCTLSEVEVGYESTADATDRLVTAALDALHEASEHHKVFVGGTDKLADAFDAADQLRAVLSLLEHQLTVVSLVQELLDRDCRVAIGVENGVPSLSECTVVLAPYSAYGTDFGTIGVIGPTRMDYRKVISAVDVVGQQLGSVLNQA